MAPGPLGSQPLLPLVDRLDANQGLYRSVTGFSRLPVVLCRAGLGQLGFRTVKQFRWRVLGNVARSYKLSADEYQPPVDSMPDNQLGALAMVECPRLLFPFARQIIADATRGGGFPPLLLEPVDFVALYRERLRREAEGSGPPLNINPPANA